jgi:hypothetical protein
MNYIFYILFFIFFISCRVNKVENEIELDVSNKDKQIEDIKEKDKNIEINLKVNKPLMKIKQNSYNSIDNKEAFNTKNKSLLLDEYNIKNHVDTTDILDFNLGIIAYNIPNDFKVNEWSTIKLRITRDNKIEYVVLGNGSRPIPIVNPESNDDVIIDKIEVCDFITAKLYSDDGVDINIVTESRQSLLKGGYTEWVWRIRPNTSNSCYIKMVITISERDLVVYEETIKVEPDWYWSFSKWVSKWWQAITATIITPILIPFFIWLFKKEK